MKKKITIGTAAAIAALAAVLSFQITYVAMSGVAADRYSTSDNGDFISRVTERLSAVDSRYRELYIDDLDDDKLIEGVLKGYVEGTGDKFGAYYTAEEYESFLTDLNGESVGIGVNVIYNSELDGIEIVNVLPDSPALEAGIEVGDVIVYIGDDRQSISELGYEAALEALRGDEGTQACFVVKRGDDETEYTVNRAKVENITVYSRIYTEDDSVGIVRVTGFDKGTAEQFKTAVKGLLDGGCDKLVFDMRYNPGGELGAIVDVLDFLLPEGPILRVYDSDGQQVKEYTSDESSVDCPMAVIVNSGTASAAELFTAALRDYGKAQIVGETTYGKGCMQTTVPLSDGGALEVTYRMFKPPYSESYHGMGIVPDVEVEPDSAIANKNIYKISDAEDNQLAAAVATLK